MGITTIRRNSSDARNAGQYALSIYVYYSYGTIMIMIIEFGATLSSDTRYLVARPKGLERDICATLRAHQITSSQHHRALSPRSSLGRFVTFNKPPADIFVHARIVATIIYCWGFGVLRGRLLSHVRACGPLYSGH